MLDMARNHGQAPACHQRYSLWMQRGSATGWRENEKNCCWFFKKLFQLCLQTFKIHSLVCEYNTATSQRLQSISGIYRHSWELGLNFASNSLHKQPSSRLASSFSLYIHVIASVTHNLDLWTADPSLCWMPLHVTFAVVVAVAYFKHSFAMWMVTTTLSSEL